MSISVETLCNGHYFEVPMMSAIERFQCINFQVSFMSPFVIMNAWKFELVGVFWFEDQRNCSN